MNVLITLPKCLIDKILSGEKKCEMRKCLPKKMEIGVDGFFVVEKGTDNVRCWCRVDVVREMYVDSEWIEEIVPIVCVSRDYIERYAGSSKVYLWQIGRVIRFEEFKRSSLCVDKNPQQFVYTPIRH